MKNLKLTDEEKWILGSYNRGEWKPIKNIDKEIKRYRRIAKNTLKKDKGVNIVSVPCRDRARADRSIDMRR